MLGALATAAMAIESGPQVGDVLGDLPDGTPVRWGGNGNGNMEARSTDPDAFLLLPRRTFE